jgi:hypothetical protein
MNKRIHELFTVLKQEAEGLIADCQNENMSNHAHDRAITVLMKIVEIEQRCKHDIFNKQDAHDNDGSTGTNTQITEINKIQRRLKLWAQVDRQSQVNAKLLNLFLKLAHAGEIVTVDRFRDAYGNDAEFLRHYPQLKNISPKNHGKIFEEDKQVVSIWEPVIEYVEEYKDNTARLNR